ncbi:hypothetical protein M902_0702 [Bacteriovorax sp. BAL6_X]|uniref:AAA family ATPase n=1 Tax=Bacteriovorax sp. BAL6_X TaxID=1201290 RepID=UPI000385D9DB|nr:AAA family ATPase [Bacteriovorax sp. BAL6_X]EPZ49832.1 hypothetical protein M902_0702 [Bacteriovorax sp. BAL6_X]
MTNNSQILEHILDVQREAKKIQHYFQEPQAVIDFINNMDKELIVSLTNIYRDKGVNRKGKLRMVNAVRLEVLLRLQKRETITIELVNNMMDNIRDNNTKLFINSPSDTRQAIKEFKEKKRDSFSNWKKPARMFNTFYFHEEVESKINNHLENIGNFLKEQSGLKDYSYHYNNFKGSTQFGSERCWIALYPTESTKHKHAYQLFLSIRGDAFHSGIATGSNVKINKDNFEEFHSAEQAIENIWKHKEELLSYNDNISLKEPLKGEKEHQLEEEIEEEAESVYDFELALETMFLGENKLKSIIDALNIKKNIILQGPPGVGKTFIAQKIAWLFNGTKDTSVTEMVQFHQSYSYEDFIQGIRPNKDGTFEVRDGVFYNFCKTASKNKNKKFFFIIDEINRGNLSKIFGELMMLLESDKRFEEYSIKLTYSEDDESFFIPDNVYVIGTMNTADRSLAMVDFALRRRFAFISLSPEYQSKKFHSHLIDNGVPSDVANMIVQRMTSLNEKIINKYKQLGEGFAIGHSFFSSLPEDIPYNFKWYQSVIKTEIAPLLREYWFDNEATATQEIEELLRAG